MSSAIQTELQLDPPVQHARYQFQKQMEALVAAVGDGRPRSLREIEVALAFKYGQSGLSARIRDLRRGVPGFEQWDSQHTTDGKKHWYRIFRKNA